MITDQWAPPPQARRTNSFAIAALVCGIVQFSGLFPATIIAIILGHKALRQIRQTGDDGYGMAKAGLVLGYVGIAVILSGLMVVACASSSPAVPGPYSG